MQNEREKEEKLIRFQIPHDKNDEEKMNLQL
jgi:hypothetical protein